MNNKKDIFVQIGIHTHMRFGYLFHPTDLQMWVINAQHEGDNAMLPAMLINEVSADVHLIGVDFNPKTIENVKNLYSDKPGSYEFLNLCVWDKDLDEIAHNSWSLKTDEVHPFYTEDREPAVTACVTLKTLFDTILENHPKSRIFGLHLDVEGAELDILRAFDFSVRPEFLHIEIHSDEIGTYGMHEIIKLLYNHDYFLLEKTKQRKVWLKFTTRSVEPY